MKQIVIFNSGDIIPHYLILKTGEIQHVLQEVDLNFSFNIPIAVFKKNGLNYRNLSKNIIAIALENNGCKHIINPYIYCNKYKWKGVEVWDMYPEAQLNALTGLLKQLCAQYNIPIKYNSDIWDVSRRALSGSAGIWAHLSFKQEAVDPHPQHQLVSLLKLL